MKNHKASVEPRRSRTCFHSTSIALGLALAVLAANWPLVADAQDILVVRNGDRLTGEIRGLQRGILRFNTDATATIDVRWDHVTELSSPEYLEVALSDGRRFFGALLSGAPPAQLRIATAGGPVDLPIQSVVGMEAIEGDFLDRIDLGVDVGYSFASANSLSQFTAGADFSHRSEEKLFTVSFDTARSESASAPRNIRVNNTFAWRHFSDESPWDFVYLGALERNDKLGLTRRESVGAGFARWLAETNSHQISVLAGLDYSTEDSGDVVGDNSTEALLGLNLDWFRFDDPELDVSVRLLMFERLSSPGRTRGNLDLDFRWEVLRDLFWGFSLYYSFSSAAAGANVSTNDHGIFTSVGWSF